MIGFHEFKNQKRLKLGKKEGEYQVQEADKELFTDFEKKAAHGRYMLEKRTKVKLDARASIVCCEISEASKLIVLGQSNGVFSIFNLETLEAVHSFQISESTIDSVSINQSGEWIALASKAQGQLLVWEWKSETYVLKQQGHQFDLNCVAYSPDGSYLATGADDGKVKIWTTKNYLCFVTFTEHTSTVTDLAFLSKKGNAVVSCSLDGTVRAFDLVKYRNFRSMMPA